MGSNQLGDEGAALFSAILGSNSHLNKHLDLSDNSINCEEIAYLASSLMVNIFHAESHSVLQSHSC